jgi:hypothetical protein
VGGSRPPYNADGYSNYGSRRGENNDELFSRDENSSPWYLKPCVLALWGLAVVLLIATIIFGLIALASGNGGGGPATAPSSTTTKSSTTTTSPTTTTPTTTTPTETITTAVPPATTPPPWTQRPRHHWNMPSLPNMPHVPGLNP